MLPLSKENVTCVFRTGVPPGKELSGRMYKLGLGWYLAIPSDLHNNPPSAADWWLKQGRDQRWRSIIFSLDRDGETGIADELMPYSEPPSGV